MSETQVVSQLGGKLLGGGGTGIWQYDNFISKEECEGDISASMVLTVCMLFLLLIKSMAQR
jgi:hypothetical protein